MPTLSLSLHCFAVQIFQLHFKLQVNALTCQDVHSHDWMELFHQIADAVLKSIASEAHDRVMVVFTCSVTYTRKQISIRECHVFPQ
ncbi:uncharacterized protein BJ212DRAFT_140572 [Suillus subaureus]|uniref:Uncharacterized protein n=1 Tax=Suillus subaureus TaxID=48587 RepID=A0A9P7ECU1_9AGAM|nr:uncharacterized protein BJ212DRAFT_140572 [Suillus subaureus]KAG1817694.1 hypothetical protein BJ212DRAFT_140572 [Suillus subaureus]